MGLDANRLGDAIKSAIDAVSDKTNRQDLFRALGSAIVGEIQGHAVASATGTDDNGDHVTVTGTVS